MNNGLRKNDYKKVKLTRSIFDELAKAIGENPEDLLFIVLPFSKESGPFEYSDFNGYSGSTIVRKEY